MAKDRVNYRNARQSSLTSRQAESSIGITTLCTAIDSEIDPRPVALMKWSLDDFIVEEKFAWLDHATNDVSEPPPSPVSSPESDKQGKCTLLVKVLSEGVPDPFIENLFRHRCPRGVSFHFLTPVDFASCAVRHVWIRSYGDELRRNFRTTQLLHTPAGEVRLYPAFPVPVPPTAPYFPLCLLPDLRYTVLLRDIRGSLNDVLPRLRELRRRGFLNYGHMARHGLGTLHTYNTAKCLLARDYVGFLQGYAWGLSEGTSGVRREMPALLQALANPRATPQDWGLVRDGLEAALRKDGEGVRRPQTGLYAPHHELLRDFLTRAADVAPRRHDAAEVLRESVSRAFLHETMRTASEVHFNALASLRRERFGDRVVVGDIVVAPDDDDDDGAGRRMRGAGGDQIKNLEHATSEDPRRSCGRVCRGDVYEGAADHINGNILSPYLHPDWVDFALHDRGVGDGVDSESELQQWYRRLRVVRTQAEADSCSISQVVLPFWGQQVDSLPMLPAHSIGEIFRPLARELQIEGLSRMKTASMASYRHFVAKPFSMGAYLFDTQRGWDWVEGDSYGESLKKRMYQDHDGIYRVQSPLMDATSKNMIARSGIRGENARKFFLKPAQKQNITCVVEFTLPRGSPVTSALREVFQFTTLSPSAIFRLLSAH
ncbi:unnamed protein product [Phytomonas sp. EM1]|nr:unnamed protein product [Phytomonas sp. EM1]|eukprot:CCW62106.1 unnamed protein product [Phytomonas sp. isolate EM1]